jgi:ferrous iron transport protein B
MELPPYRMPTLRGLCIHTWERTWQYIRKAGTVLLAISILLWAAMTFPSLNAEQTQGLDHRQEAITAQIEEMKANASEVTPELEEALKQVDADRAEATLRNSFAGRAGVAMEGASQFAGFNWRVNIALLGGFAAKEVIVSTLATAYSLGEIDTKEAEPLSKMLAQDATFPKAAAIALIAFVILYAPCSVTIVTMAKEVGWKWATFAMTFNTGLAYLAAVVIFQAARLFV